MHEHTADEGGFAISEPQRRPLLRRTRQFVVKALVTGLLVILPIYLAILLLLKVTNSFVHLVRPFAHLLPEWVPAEKVLSAALVLLISFVLGVAVLTPKGRALRERFEKSALHRLPGYTLFRGLTQQIAGESRDKVWKPALAVIEDALVPSFIIEELPDGRFTVFVPSVPTPFAGTIYILSPERVHALDVPVTHLLKVVSRWGCGAKDLVAAMKPDPAGTPAANR